MTMTTTRLTGDALLERLQIVNENANLLRVEATATAKALACGYVKENGKPDFTAFYEALIEAKGLNLPTEDPEMDDTEAELRERFGDDAVDAFIEYWSADDLEYFEEAYCGEFESGAKFAEDFACESWGIDVDNLPGFIVVNWEASWEELRWDFTTVNGFIFRTNW